MKDVLEMEVKVMTEVTLSEERQIGWEIVGEILKLSIGLDMSVISIEIKN
jgi:hypothetical protein